MADDDIIELTDIVKFGTAQRGKAEAVGSAASGSSPHGASPSPDEFATAEAAMPSQPAGSAGVDAAVASAPDFGADLDALLLNYDTADSPEAGADNADAASAAYAAGSEASTAQANAEVAGAEAPNVATPVAATGEDAGQVAPLPLTEQDADDHIVDPNEELELPPLSDLDALLAELGVQDDSADADAAAAQSAATDASDVADGQSGASPVTTATDIDILAEFDSSLQAQDAEPNSPEAGSAGLSASDDPFADLLEEISGESAPEQADIAATDDIGATAQENVASASAADSEADEIDMNELDALLDSVLASAPRQSAAAPSAVSTPEPGSQAAADATLEEALSGGDGENELAQAAGQPAGADDSLEPVSENLEADADPFEAALSSLGEAESASTDSAEVAKQAQELEDVALAPHDEVAPDKVAPDEVAPDGTQGDAPVQAAMSPAELSSDVATGVAALTAKDEIVALQGEVVALQAEVIALKAELADLQANIDKHAAAAAAKVIREEIAALATQLR